MYFDIISITYPVKKFEIKLENFYSAESKYQLQYKIFLTCLYFLMHHYLLKLNWLMDILIFLLKTCVFRIETRSEILFLTILFFISLSGLYIVL